MEWIIILFQRKRFRNGLTKEGCMNSLKFTGTLKEFQRHKSKQLLRKARIAFSGKNKRMNQKLNVEGLDWMSKEQNIFESFIQIV